jgi:type I restriction enzyme, S subunit
MKWVKLGDVIKITSGGTPLTSKREYYANGTIRWVKTGDLKSQYLFDAPDRITQLGLESSSAKIFPVNTVLIAMYGATIGNCSILKIEAATNQACAALLPNEQINEEYLYFYLRTIKQKLIDQGVGGGQPNISGTILKKTNFPLVRLKDQTYIANILNKAEAMISQRKEGIRLLDELLKSTFLEMFGDPVRNEKGWQVFNLGKFVNKIIAGSSYGGEQKEELDIDELGVLKVSAVTSGIFNPKEFKAVKKKAIKGNIETPKKGDLLFSRANTKELVGATCIVDRDYPNLFLPDKLWKILLDEDEVNKHFINFLVKHRAFKSTLTKDATGTSGSMLNISMSKLKHVPFPKPPIQLQGKFADIVERTETIRTQFKTGLTELENLYASLSQRAFNGELKPSA